LRLTKVGYMLVDQTSSSRLKVSWLRQPYYLFIYLFICSFMKTEIHAYIQTDITTVH